MVQKIKGRPMQKLHRSEPQSRREIMIGLTTIQVACFAVLSIACDFCSFQDFINYLKIFVRSRVPES
jgi:hypothetical protein